MASFMVVPALPGRGVWAQKAQFTNQIQWGDREQASCQVVAGGGSSDRWWQEAVLLTGGGRRQASCHTISRYFDAKGRLSGYSTTLIAARPSF